MTLLQFEVFGTPQPAGSKRKVNWHAKDGRSGTNLIDANPKANVWKEEVARVAARAFSGPLLDGPLAVEFLFEVPRPQGHFGKRGLRASAPSHPTSRPDALKLARGVEDALSKVVYRDDAQIVEETLIKRYGERARLRVTIQRPSSYAVSAAPEQRSLLEEAAR